MKHLLLALVPFLLFIELLPAQPRLGPRGRMGAGMPALERLELTDAQQKLVGELRVGHQKKMVQLRSKIEEARIDLRALMTVEKPDRASIEKSVANVSDLERQVELARVGHWFDVYAQLTPKQQEVWREEFGKGPAGLRRGAAHRREGRGCGHCRWE